MLVSQPLSSIHILAATFADPNFLERLKGDVGFRCLVLGFHPCDTVQNRVDLKCCNSTRVAYCAFICNRLHLSGTVLSLETVANIVILIQWCGEPGFDSDVL